MASDSENEKDSFFDEEDNSRSGSPFHDSDYEDNNTSPGFHSPEKPPRINLYALEIGDFLAAQRVNIQAIIKIKRINNEKDQKNGFRSKDKTAWDKELRTANLLDENLFTLTTRLDKSGRQGLTNTNFLPEIKEMLKTLRDDKACSFDKNNKGFFHRSESKLEKFATDLEKKAGVLAMDLEKKAKVLNTDKATSRRLSFS